MADSKRFLDSFNHNDLYDDVTEKRALPELILKQNILNAQDSMLLSERRMMNNFRLRGKFYRNEVVDFNGTILLLFGFLKNMIRDLVSKNKADVVTFKYLCMAEQGKSFSAYQLVLFKNFLLKYLHKIGITNLFVNRGKSFAEEIEEDF